MKFANIKLYKMQIVCKCNSSFSFPTSFLYFNKGQGDMDIMPDYTRVIKDLILIFISIIIYYLIFIKKNQIYVLSLIAPIFGQRISAIFYLYM